MAELTVVTVSFRSKDALATMLPSVPADVPVVVVDNGGDDDPLPDPVRSNLQLLRNEANLGFGAANNRGAALVGSDLILFLNPDAILEDGACEALISAAKAYPEAAAFNPRILDAGGRIRNKRRSVLFGGSVVPNPADHERLALNGGALLVRRAIFEAVGGFDEAIFLYHEDDDLSIRMGRHGTLRLVPEAVVRHQSGHSSGRGAQIAALKGYHLGHSRLYAMRKHGRPVAALRCLGKALVQLLDPQMLVSARKRAKSIAFLRGVLAAWRG